MEILFEILMSEKPSVLIREREDHIFSLIPSLQLCKGFKQNNHWHIYDVYDNILHVVDGVPNVLILRLAALFHDVGKPFTYTEDENGVGHFYNHWKKSQEIFLEFSKKYNLEEELNEKVSKLIFYHDLQFEKLSENELEEILAQFDKSEIDMLFALKSSDLLAQNPEFHYLLDSYELEKERVLKKLLYLRKRD